MIESGVRIIRPGMPRTRVTFQLSGTLQSRVGGGDTVEQAVRSVITWVQEKFPEPLSPAAREGESFGAELPGQEVRCVGLLDEGIWALRLAQPDAPYPGQPAVAGRTWLTDIALRKTEGAVLVGVRVRCSSLPYALDDVRLVRPRVVVDLARDLQLVVDRELAPNAWRISTPENLASLHALLTNPRRNLPVYVLTQPDKQRLGIDVQEFLLEEDVFARRCLGVAHVVAMPAAAAFEWTKLVGKVWSVYLGAVRTYRPGLSFEEDAPTDHPLILPERVLAFRYRELVAEPAFAEFLIDQAHRHVATAQVSWDQLLFLEDATIQQANNARRQAADGASRLELSAVQESALNAKITELESDLSIWQTMAEEAQQKQLRAEDENRRLKAKLERLRHAFAENTGGSADALIAIPETYDDFDGWVEEHLSDRLVLHSRASRALKDAVYRDVSLVARSLLLLAGPYHAMQIGQPGANREFETALKDLGLQCRKSIAAHRAREEGVEYFVRYPTHRDSEQFLEWHLTKGSGKPEHCLRIYFFWHDPTQRVVVGWLPSHLDNRMT